MRCRTGSKKKVALTTPEQKKSYEDFILENIDEALEPRKEEGYYSKMAKSLDGSLTKRQWKTIDQRSEPAALSSLMKRKDIEFQTKLRLNSHLQVLFSLKLDEARKSELPPSLDAAFTRKTLF
jgi:hypothetical protein